jgi:small subunit ribosomal protein S6
MPFYENVFIARQDIATTQADALVDSFTAIVEGLGGKVTKKENWGLRSLTYRIAKNRKGHYLLLNIDAPPAAINEMERNMRLNEDVLRYLTVRVDELEEGPSAMLQKRDRDERGDRGDRGDRPRRFDRGGGGGFGGDRGDRGGDRGDRGGDRGERPRFADKPAETNEGAAE